MIIIEEASMLKIEIIMISMVTEAGAVDWHQITKLLKSSTLYVVNWMFVEKKIN